MSANKPGAIVYIRAAKKERKTKEDRAWLYPGMNDDFLPHTQLAEIFIVRIILRWEVEQQATCLVPVSSQRDVVWKSVWMTSALS